MNATAKIRPSRGRYIPIVNHHLPRCAGKELDLRCSILFLRDQAASTMQRCSYEAYGTLSEVQRIGSAFAYAQIPIDPLERARYLLLRLTTCASGLEQLAFSLSYPDYEAGR